MMTRIRIIQRFKQVKFTLLRCTSADTFFSCCDSVAAPRQRPGHHDQVSAENNERRRGHRPRRTRIIRRYKRVQFSLFRCTSAELFFSCCDSVAAPRQRSRRHDQVSAKNNERLCVCVSRLVTMVCIWCTRSLGRLNFLDLLLRNNALVGGHPGPRKKADERSSTR